MTSKLQTCGLVVVSQSIERARPTFHRAILRYQATFPTLWASFCCKQTNTNVHCCLTLIDVEPDSRSSGWMSFLCKLELDTVSRVLERLKRKNVEWKLRRYARDRLRSLWCRLHSATLHCIRLEHLINALERIFWISAFSLIILLHNLQPIVVTIDVFCLTLTTKTWRETLIEVRKLFHCQIFHRKCLNILTRVLLVGCWFLGKIDIDVHLTTYAPHAHTICAPQSTDGVG